MSVVKVALTLCPTYVRVYCSTCINVNQINLWHQH